MTEERKYAPPEVVAVVKGSLLRVARDLEMHRGALEGARDHVTEVETNVAECARREAQLRQWLTENEPPAQEVAGS